MYNQPRVQVKEIQRKKEELELEALKHEQLMKKQAADKNAAVQQALETVRLCSCDSYAQICIPRPPRPCGSLSRVHAPAGIAA